MSAQTFGPRKGLGPVSCRREVEAAPEGKSQPGSEGRGGRLVLKAETVEGRIQVRESVMPVGSPPASRSYKKGNTVGEGEWPELTLGG